MQNMNKIEQNKIQITLVESQYDDIVFSEIYQLINPTLKKKTIEKALISFLKKSSDEVLEMFFGDDLEEAKKLAKKRVPRAKKPTRKRTIKKEVVENKPQLKDVISDEKEEIEELVQGVMEEVSPTESAQEEEIVTTEVVMETPEIEVKKDDISSDQEIWNILKSSNTGSSTTKEKKGKKKESVFKETKKKDEKSKLKEVSEEQLKLNKEKFLTEMEMEIEERKRISKEKRIASDKEMEEFFARLRRERKENKGK